MRFSANAGRYMVMTPGVLGKACQHWKNYKLQMEATAASDRAQTQAALADCQLTTGAGRWPTESACQARPNVGLRPAANHSVFRLVNDVQPRLSQALGSDLQPTNRDLVGQRRLATIGCGQQPTTPALVDKRRLPMAFFFQFWHVTRHFYEHEVKRTSG